MRKTFDLARQKRIVDIAFLICFLLMLVVPVVKMNRAGNQISEIDNRKLVEFPTVTIESRFRTEFEAYLADRIGFRSRMIGAYQKICDVMFRKLKHPIYMYGEKRYVFFNDTGGYVDDYQHLNIDKAYIESCGNYLERLYKYIGDRNIKFIYFLVPDKKSVYSEFFPRSINIKGDKSQATMLIDEVKRKQIPYIHPIKEFLEAKRHEQIYNRKYDAAHWNEHGAFIGHSMITQMLQEYFPGVNLLAKSDFNISMGKVTTLPVSHFEIDEDIPLYQSKNQNTEFIGGYNALFNLDEYQFNLIQNKSAIWKPKIMVFRDSYFGVIERYYGENFSEIISILSFENLKNIEYFINIFEPDVVLLENVERVIKPGEYLFSVVNMKRTVLHDYSDLSLPSTANKINIGINPKASGIIVPAAEILSTITGTAAYLSDGKPGKTLFAKVNGKYYPAKYPSAEGGKETTFSLTLKADTLRKADKIEFTLISSDGKFKSQPVAFPLIIEK